VTYKNYKGENVSINGCEILPGWSFYSGNIYKKRNQAWPLSQLFVDKTMYLIARWPNNPDLDPLMKRYTNPVQDGTSTSLTDSRITGNWVGASVWTTTMDDVIGAGRTITSQNGSTIFWDNPVSWPPSAYCHYFFIILWMPLMPAANGTRISPIIPSSFRPLQATARQTIPWKEEEGVSGSSWMEKAT